MRYAGLIKEDFENGTGVGCTLFVQGCDRHCPGCFNQETWDFDGGKEFTQIVKQEIIDELKKPFVTRFTLLGGEPLASKNIEDDTRLIAEIRARFPDISIWLYTSYTFEEVLDDPAKFKCASLCDVVVDGRFVESKKDISLKFRGSSNQRIIDVKTYLLTGEVVTI